LPFSARHRIFSRGLGPFGCGDVGDECLDEEEGLLA